MSSYFSAGATALRWRGFRFRGCTGSVDGFTVLVFLSVNSNHFLQLGQLTVDWLSKLLSGDRRRFVLAIQTCCACQSPWSARPAGSGFTSSGLSRRRGKEPFDSTSKALQKALGGVGVCRARNSDDFWRGPKVSAGLRRCDGLEVLITQHDAFLFVD